LKKIPPSFSYFTQVVIGGNELKNVLEFVENLVEFGIAAAIALSIGNKCQF
jgi:hypothetical protein